jgi:hypothetical protein
MATWKGDSFYMGEIGGNCSKNGEAVNVLDAYVHVLEYVLQTVASKDMG